jgi:hypothetical protein
MVVFGPNVFLHETTLNESTSQIKKGVTKAEDYEIETVTFGEIVRSAGCEPYRFY